MSSESKASYRDRRAARGMDAARLRRNRQVAKLCFLNNLPFTDGLAKLAMRVARLLPACGDILGWAIENSLYWMLDDTPETAATCGLGSRKRWPGMVTGFRTDFVGRWIGYCANTKLKPLFVQETNCAFMVKSL